MINALLFNDTSYEKHHGSQLVVRQIDALAKGVKVIFLGGHWFAGIGFLSCRRPFGVCRPEFREELGVLGGR